jgi:hypothetical protein
LVQAAVVVPSKQLGVAGPVEGYEVVIVTHLVPHIAMLVMCQPLLLLLQALGRMYVEAILVVVMM